MTGTASRGLERLWKEKNVRRSSLLTRCSVLNLQDRTIKDTGIYAEIRITVSEKMSGKASQKPPDRILQSVSINQTITIAELVYALGVTPRTIECKINKLQSQCLLKLIGLDKGGYWDTMNKGQKY
jgi:hypothetical protein